MKQPTRVLLTAVLFMQIVSFAFAQGYTDTSPVLPSAFGGGAPTPAPSEPPNRAEVEAEKARIVAMDPTISVKEREARTKDEKETIKGLKKAGRDSLLAKPLNKNTIGQPTSLAMDYGTELIQILGQIVVDRASAQAYDLLKNKTEQLLQCKAKTPIKIDFKETCETLDSTRLQDLAASPNLLYKAVATDGLHNIMTRIPLQSPEVSSLLDENVAALILGAVMQAQGKAYFGTPEEILSEFLARAVVDNKIVDEDKLENVTAGQKAILVASLAVLRCKQSGTLSPKCEYNDLVDQYATAIAPGSAEVRIGAKSLAKNLIAGLTPAKDNPRLKYHASVEALFDATCMIASKRAIVCSGLAGAGVIPKNITSVSTAPLTPPEILQAIGLAQNVALAAIDGQGNELIQSIMDVQAMLGEKSDQDKYARAFRICGSILNYSATYTAKDLSAVDAHQARQKILESLTTDMTNRTGREGDTIWSVGGSLRLASGARFGRGSSNYYGPLSLPIGLGYQNNSGGHSFHAELSFLDIGQYVSFQDEGTVQSPNLADSLAPSATIGWSWGGKQLPYFIAATGGYSPQYKFKDTDSKRGAFFVGAVIGIYVPFFDLN